MDSPTAQIRISFDKDLTATDRQKLQVHDCTEGYRMSAAHTVVELGTYSWITGTPDWTRSAAGPST